jgi:hypothetical protein
MKVTERRMEFHELKLPDGRRADDLRVGALYRELSHIPGVTAFMGKNDLLVTYRNHLEAQQPAAKPYDHTAEFIKAAVPA